MSQDFESSFVKFVRAQSVKTQQTLLALPFTAERQAAFDEMTLKSTAEQRRIEAADTTPFEIYRNEYVSPARLGIGSKAPSFALLSWRFLLEVITRTRGKRRFA